MGRVFTGSLPDRVNWELASYASKPTGNKVDVYATAFPTVRTRLPTQAPPALISPQLSFFGSACGTVTDAQGNVTGFTAPAGGVETQMLAAGKYQWAQIQPAADPAEGHVIGAAPVDATGAFLVDVRRGFDPRTTTCAGREGPVRPGRRQPGNHVYRPQITTTRE
jgi:hypothetical protein